MARPAALLSSSLILAALLAGCAAQAGDGAPSLAKRAVEGRWAVTAPSPVVTPPGPLPADLAGRLARWRADAAAADAAFRAAQGETETAVAAARGAAVGSERWVVGQQALSRLIAARAGLTGALAELDRLYIDRSVDEAIDGLPDIYALRGEMIDLLTQQDAVIERLQGAMAG